MLPLRCWRFRFVLRRRLRFHRHYHYLNDPHLTKRFRRQRRYFRLRHFLPRLCL